ncbi:MAG TPA: PAS domain S-box protein [Myxococcales bacterium]|nr:PAS domain S-box protein [Myxococcales bacterium]
MAQDFFNLVEHASDLILIVIGGRIAYANKAFAERLGYDRDSLRGRPAFELAHPDERDAVRTRIGQTLHGEQKDPLRRRLLHRDGRELIIYASTFPIEFEGAPAAVLVGRDITEQVQAEEQKRRTEADFRNVVENLPSGVIIHRAGDIRFANPPAARTLGKSPAELVGTSVMDYIIDPPENYRDLLWKNLTVPTPMPVRELAVRGGEGEVRLVEVSSIHIRFDDMDARLVHVNDVTERRAAERHLRALVDSSPLAICSVDAQARIVSWNRAAERIFGWEPAPAMPAPRPVDPVTEERLRQLAAAAARDGTTESERDLVRTKDGGPMRVRSSMAPLLDPEGKVSGYVLTTADVTGQHRASEQLRAAAAEWQDTFDAIDAGVLLVEGKTGEIARINRPAAELAGRPAASLGLLTDAEPWIAASQLVDVAADSGAPALEQVAGFDRTWLVSASPLPQGRVIVTIRDVSRLSRLQERLRRSEAMSAMGALVAGVAHEVRNPLFGMSATLDAMEQIFGTDPNQEPFLRAMRRELDRISSLMRDLLEYGRPPAVQLVIDALAPVVALAARSCQPAAEMASARIANEVGADAGSLPMDAGRLAQVFQNLIENAVQHSPAGATVRICAQWRSREVAVSVLDSGPGFDPRDLPRIFEPFFSKRRGGTGLGLSIVQRIVEQHGGRLEAGNRPEGGAAVTVILPLP